MGAASGGQNASVSAHNEDGAQNDHPGGLTTRKVTGLDCSVSDQHVVLLRTSAVRVRNPNSGKSTLAYAQHDTAPQATLISQTLCDELNLETETDSIATLCTLGDQTAVTKGRSNFELESLSTGEKFPIENAFVVPYFNDDENVLPHAVDTTGLENFREVNIPTILDRKCIDVLIGQADNHLLTVLDERESVHPGKPSYVLTRLGPIASGGRVPVESNSKAYTSLKVNSCNCKESNYELKSQIQSLKETLREYELEDEVTQPSRNDEKARELVERDVKIVNDRYEIPVPLNMEVVKSLPNNFDYALERTKAVRSSALKNDTLKQTLLETFRELIDEQWIVPVDRNATTGKVWYLPFFVTKQEKARVVYDGAATFRGKCLNQAVLAGTNLLNNLVKVLMRFRIGQYACIADLSKCFF